MQRSLRLEHNLNAADVAASVDALLPRGIFLEPPAAHGRSVPGSFRVAILGLPVLWTALLAVSAALSRDPDGALRWLRARLTRKMFATRAALLDEVRARLPID